MSREPKQETEQGHEIPVPKRRDVLADLRKVAHAAERHRDDPPTGDEGPSEQGD